MATGKTSRRSRIAAGTKRRAAKVSVPTPTIQPTVVKPIPPTWQLAKTGFATLRSRWPLFTALTLTYALLYGLFVQGNLIATAQSNDVPVVAQLLLNANDNGLLQAALVLLISLALIRVLRRVQGGDPTSYKDAFYNGMTPMIPLALVVLIGLVQLLPLLLGANAYQLVVLSGAAASTVELVGWGIVAVGLAVLSVYWLIPTIIAMYVVTLPGMTPLRSLRAARGLLKGRRWVVLRYVLMLIVALAIISIIVVIPIALLAPVVAGSAVALNGAIVLTVAHVYLYTLYKELLHEDTVQN